MAEMKTKKTKASVGKFLNAIKDEQVRDDCWIIADIMQVATKSKPVMLGAAIVGFGKSRLQYADGREIDWIQVAFSPRKNAITLYLWSGFANESELMANLGKHQRGKSCLYIKRLSDIRLATLKKIVKASVMHAKNKSAR